MCNTLQHTAPCCLTLQHTATHCNTLQHTATHSQDAMRSERFLEGGSAYAMDVDDTDRYRCVRVCAESVLQCVAVCVLQCVAMC